MTDYATKSRALADYLEVHQPLHEKHSDRYEYPSIYIYANDWDDFQDIIKHMDGYDKNGTNGSLTATHVERTHDGETLFRVCVTVSQVCESKPKLDENGQPVTRKVRQWVETDEEEVVMEYDCPKVWSA